MARWNPWRALRQRDHVTLRWARLPAGTRGLWVSDGTTATITIDARLGRVERNATLAHELVHDERGVMLTADAPRGVRAKEESIVADITAERLVPAVELEGFVAARVGCGEGVTAAMVAEEFEVPVRVAVRAIALLPRGR